LRRKHLSPMGRQHAQGKSTFLQHLMLVMLATLTWSLSSIAYSGTLGTQRGKPKSTLQPIQRRAACASASLWAGFFLGPACSWGALPTSEDYFRGMYLNMVKDPDEEDKPPPPPPDPLADNIRDAAEQALGSLQKIEPLLKNGLYEDARVILASPRIKSIGLKMSPSRAPVSTIGVWASSCGKGSTCESSVLAARSSLQQLEEWCFTNRIVYFNSVDMQNVVRDKAAGAANAKVPEVDEAFEYLKEGQDAFRDILTSLK